MNDYGLIVTAEDAFEFKQVSDQRVREHSPFYPNGGFAQGGSVLSLPVFFYGEGAGVEIPGTLDFIGRITSLTTKLPVWTITIGTPRDHVTSSDTSMVTGIFTRIGSFGPTMRSDRMRQRNS